MTKRYAVIGNPVSHSLSPLMHTGWIADHGLDATYEAHLLRSDDPVAAIRGLTQFAGMNVTVPHKEAAAKAANSSLKVANVLAQSGNGELLAYNTDGAGFLDALDKAESTWRANVRTALIIGAGGAAREIGRAIGETARDYQGSASLVERVIFANRTYSSAIEAAAGTWTGEALRWEHLATAFADADLIVQATTLGMAGGDSHAWPVEVCGANTIVADIVYRPLETPLLAAARARGLKTVDGLGMLVHQGALSFEIWFGIKPDVAKARARLETVLA
jgi:shikimate dehydrogenase